MNEEKLNKQGTLLSICIPAYDRPIFLRRTLNSIIHSNENLAKDVEIVVSDDSTTNASEIVVREVLGCWAGAWKYKRNKCALGMAKNWNSLLNIASSNYLLILHDDDFLTDGGLRKVLSVLKNEQGTQKETPVFLFNVRVVNVNGSQVKFVRFKTEFLPPSQALSRLLFNSSFVRFPGIVLNRSVFQHTGYFNENIGEVADVEMWVRLFSKYGVFCQEDISACYTIHSNALTQHMFNNDTIKKLKNIFDYAERLNLLSKERVEICKANFFHQFILAGSIRALKRFDLGDAENTFNLLKKITVKRKYVILKWKVVFAFLNLFFWVTSSFTRVFSDIRA